MNISPISFGSTYRVNINSHDGWVTLNRLEEFNALKLDKDVIEIVSQDKNNNIYKSIFFNDQFDNIFESFLKSFGIRYTKTPTEELFSETGIKTRMRVPNYVLGSCLPNLVNIKTDRFDKIFSKNPFEQYIGNYETISQPERYNGFIKYLKTNEPIDASIVYISEANGKPQVDFQDGRHRYAVMRDMGFKTIPVAMSEKSFLTGKKFGLIE